MKSSIKFLLSFSTLLLFMGLTFNACTNKSQEEAEVKPTDKLVTTTSVRSGETSQLGIITDGIFRFTVSQDVLAEAYSSNLEANLEESGELQEARVDIPESEDEIAYLVLSGSLGEEGSASMSVNVSLDEIESGFLVMINANPVYPGLCYRNNCNNCSQVPNLPGPSCNCQSGGVNCPYSIDPTFFWVW
ncbi:MAG: hypothetical protein AAFP19_15595 [Bacteroidota bacterium]